MCVLGGAALDSSLDFFFSLEPGGVSLHSLDALWSPSLQPQQEATSRPRDADEDRLRWNVRV